MKQLLTLIMALVIAAAGMASAQAYDKANTLSLIHI